MVEAISRGFSMTSLYFHHAYDFVLFFCSEIMTRRQAIAKASSSGKAQSMLRLIGYQVQHYNTAVPSSSRQHHAHVTDLRCTASSWQYVFEAEDLAPGTWSPCPAQRVSDTSSSTTLHGLKPSHDRDAGSAMGACRAYAAGRTRCLPRR